jgi:predicted nucleic acid-binding protein
VRIFFDTSVLVAAALVQSVHHQRSLALYLEADRRHAYCAAHSLAEVYATVTRLPGNQRMACDQALLLLDNLRDRLTCVALEPDEYYAAVSAAAAAGIIGGTVYDALIAHCALKAAATTIYTWNIDHFQRCGPEVAKRARTP